MCRKRVGGRYLNSSKGSFRFRLHSQSIMSLITTKCCKAEGRNAIKYVRVVVADFAGVYTAHVTRSRQMTEVNEQGWSLFTSTPSGIGCSATAEVGCRVLCFPVACFPVAYLPGACFQDPGFDCHLLSCDCDASSFRNLSCLFIHCQRLSFNWLFAA